MGESSPILESQTQFDGNLAAELIDNTFDQVGGVAQARNNNAQDDEFNPAYIDPIVGHASSGDGVYLQRRTKKQKTKTMCFSVDVKFVIKRHHTCVENALMTIMMFANHGFAIVKWAVCANPPTRPCTTVNNEANYVSW